MQGENICCDRCGREMNSKWEIVGIQGHGGNCTGCGDNLCAVCAVKWDEHGQCKYCAMSVEELEYSLPITVQKEEKKQMHCQDCKRNIKEAVTYEQRIYRSDSFFDNRKSRTYEIAYVRQYAKGFLFRTERRRTLREALTDAHKMLDQMGLKPKE